MAFQTRTSPQKRLFTIIRTLIDLDRVSIEITKDTDTSFEFYVRCGDRIGIEKKIEGGGGDPPL